MSPDQFLKLSTLGLSLEQMTGVLDVCKGIEAEHAEQVEKSREKARARLQRWREKPENVSKRFTASQNVLKPLVQAGDAPDLENKQTNKPEKKENKSPRDELAAVLDSEHADAVVEHRNKLRKPLTAYAARQLAGSFASCPDANAAADLMIESGWLKIKPGWIESTGRQNGHGPPPGKRMNAVEAMLSLQAERENEQTSRTVNYGDDELLPPDKPGLPRLAGDFGQAFEWPVRQRDH